MDSKVSVSPNSSGMVVLPHDLLGGIFMPGSRTPQRIKSALWQILSVAIELVSFSGPEWTYLKVMEKTKRAVRSVARTARFLTNTVPPPPVLLKKGARKKHSRKPLLFCGECVTLPFTTGAGFPVTMECPFHFTCRHADCVAAQSHVASGLYFVCN